MESLAMRYQLSQLVDKRVRLTGTIVDVYAYKRRKTIQYQVTLKDVKVDQAKENLEHLNIFLPKESVSDKIIEMLKSKDFNTLTCTAKVCKYRRKTNEMGFRTDDYGVKELKKIEFKHVNGEN